MIRTEIDQREDRDGSEQKMCRTNQRYFCNLEKKIRDRCGEAWNDHKSSRLIMYLNQAGKDGMTMDQIEEKLNLTQSTASRLVSHYEEIGVVERFGKPGDKRFRKVRLTAQGQLWADEWDRSMADAEKQLLSGMSEEEIRLFYDILCKAYHNCRNIEFR